jgi:hypothetical protein
VIAYAVLMGKRCVLLLIALLALVAAPSSALAGSGNAASTQTYVQANLKLVQSGVAKLGQGRAALQSARRRIEGECKNAAFDSPQNPQSTELSNEIIGAIVLPTLQTGKPDLEKFISAAGGLRWSNSKLTNAIRIYVGKLKVMATLAPPDVCADVRAWVASGYQTLTPSTIAFDKQFMPNWVAVGETPTSLLTPFAASGQRAALRRTMQLENQLIEFEAIDGVNTWDAVMESLGLSP